MTAQNQQNNNSNFSEEEVGKLRQAVLKWIEIKESIKEQKTKKPINVDLDKSTQELKINEKEKLSKLNLPDHENKTALLKKIKPIKFSLPKLKFKSVMVILFSVVILFLIIFGIGIYYFNWQSPAASLISRYIPYPAAMVNYQIISYYDWSQQTKTLINFYEQEKNNNPDLIIPSVKETKRHILNRLIEYQLLKQLAQKYQVTVSSSEVNFQLEKLTAEIGSRQELENKLKILYGWTINDFIKEIINPLILKNKIAIALTLDDRLNEKIRKKAESVLEMVKKGSESFEDLAKKYSEDASASQGGDLGYFGLNQMVPEFEEAAFKLGAGQVSDLVKTQFGYHIIKVEEKINDRDENKTLIHARHIIMRSKDLDTYLEDLKKQAVIWQLVKI